MAAQDSQRDQLETHLPADCTFTVHRGAKGSSFRMLTLQDDDGSKQNHPLRELRPKGEADYAWDYPTAGNKRLQLACDGVPLPRNIDMMAIGIQPPIKVAVRHSRRYALLTLTA